MRKSLLFLQTRLAMMLLGIMVSSVAFGQAVLKHQYTFDDGTANDAVGGVNGTVMGAVSFEDGKAVVTGATGNTDAYITFDGSALALNTYSAISLEFFVESEDMGNVDVYTMLAYFGNNTGGNRCFWVQPTRQPSNTTRIEANNGTTSVPVDVSGAEMDDGNKHHIVAILTQTDLKYYINGGLAGSAALPATDYISQLDVVVANLFKGADGWADPNYNGALDEFNIYEGEMDATVIGEKGSLYAYGEGSFSNADLDTIFTNKGTLDPEFNTSLDYFEVVVPFGTLTVDLTVEPVVSGANVQILDGNQNEITDGVVTIGEDGTDLGITVTALDGSTTKEYYVSFFTGETVSVATLSDIQISPKGSLVPGFIPDSTNYIAMVPRNSTSVDITGIPSWAGATVNGGGTVNLIDGEGSTTITVVSEDQNNTMEYTVDIIAQLTEVGEEYYIVHKYNDLGYVAGERGDALMELALQLPLKDEPGQIWTLEESGVENQYFIKSKNGSYWQLSAGRSTWNMEASPILPGDLDSARFELDEYEPGSFIIESVARKAVSTTNFRIGTNDGNLNATLFNDKWPSDANTPHYQWAFSTASEVVPDYDNYLETLTVTPGNLAFSISTTEYYVTLPQGTGAIEIAATPRDATSTVDGTGTVAITGNEGVAIVTCTASTGEVRTYTINYIIDSDLSLMHSYTFADGTAKDAVGDADGTVMGGTIDDGIYTTFENGQHISFPGEEIAINTYPSITLEIYTNDQDTITHNSDYTMLGYFGNISGTSGTDWLMFSLGNRADIARASITAAGAEQTSVETVGLLDDFTPHHLVTILTNDSLKFYVDGNRAGALATNAGNKIGNLSNAFAYLNKGGYSADPTWMGDIYEYNIYQGQMDEATIATRAIDFPSEDASSDATLSSLLVGGVEIDGFMSYTLSYDSIMEQGSTVVPEVVGLPKNLNATVEVTQADDVRDSAMVVVTSENGEYVNTYYVKFDVFNSVESITESTVKVYPTVTTGSFRVVNENTSSVISVYNLNGGLIHQVVSNQNEEFISLQDAGMYIVKVETQGVTKTFKVIRTN